MNKQQKDYAFALSVYETLLEAGQEREAEYIRREGITNPDGSIPGVLFEIEDADEFDRALEGFTASDLCIDPEIESARKDLRRAEDQLIQYALSISPASIRDTLASGAKTSYSTRSKIIDLAFHLDTSTVRH